MSTIINGKTLQKPKDKEKYATGGVLKGLDPAKIVQGQERKLFPTDNKFFIEGEDGIEMVGTLESNKGIAMEPEQIPNSIAEAIRESNSLFGFKPDIKIEQNDNVNHPSHYTQGGIECIDALKSATIGKKGIEAVCVANIIKYLWRYEDKNGLEDIKKAQWYLNKLISEVEVSK